MKPNDNELRDEKEIFLKVIECDDASRWDSLAIQLCVNDTALLRRINRLLDAYRVPGSILGEGEGSITNDSVRLGVSDSKVDTKIRSGSVPMFRDTAKPRLIGRFEVQSVAGRGGMGVVYKAVDPALTRTVALKIPRVEWMESPYLNSRFLHEAKLASQLNHPNLVNIYEVGSTSNVAYIASQWCEGGDLAQWISNHPGPVDPQVVARLIGQVAQAIAYCHQNGIIHLDLKPANILLIDPVDSLSDAIPLVSDFGIAKAVENGWTATHTSLLMGTPMYMAPEQIEGKRDAQSPSADIFAIGVIMFELLFDRKLFVGNSVVDVVHELNSLDRLKLPRDPEIPEAIRTICRRCLERIKGDRYPTAAALAHDLELFSAGKQIHTQPVSRFKRLWNWTRLPDRTTQAGQVSIVIQVFFLLAFAATLGVKILDPSVMEAQTLKSMATEIGFIFVAYHLPVMLAAWMTIKKSKLGFIAGVFLSFGLIGGLLAVLTGLQDPLSFYTGNRLATLMMHLTLGSAAIIQLLAYLCAIPAFLATKTTQ